jgi:hypothetical protein
MLFFIFCLFLGIASFTLANLVPKVLSNEDQLPSQVIEVSEKPGSKSLYLFYQEDLSDSGKVFFLLFSKIYTEIKIDHSYQISIDDFNEVGKFYASDSFEFMKIIRAFHDRKMVLLACLLLSAEDVDYYNFAELLFDPKIQNYFRSTRKIFEVFNDLIGTLFMKPYPNSNIEEKEKLLIERKETAKIMISILQEINNSQFNFVLPFPRRIFSTQDYIRIMIIFIDGIVADSLAGAQMVNFHLKQFHKKYPGKIPIAEPFQEEIYTLLILWRFYARHIINHEYKNIWVEDLDPIFLAQLIETTYARYLENIFTVFGVEIVSEALVSLYYDEVVNLPSSCVEYKGRRIGNVGRIMSLLATEKENEQGNTCWKLKAYIKLFHSKNNR